MKSITVRRSGFDAQLQVNMNKALGILTATWSLLVAPAPLHAATFTVTTTGDSGPGSLRQAITDANASV